MIGRAPSGTSAEAGSGWKIPRSIARDATVTGRSFVCPALEQVNGQKGLGSPAVGLDCGLRSLTDPHRRSHAVAERATS